ncbi:8180_t:CDS:2 [Racocetra persica]|uniref:8180_t:CDS:1 n=1 Tax=Racocetra persica TaxID=160502 RepID=A0ACA9Q7B0_9GLOM|nr:8180_t:CDS:2 [Racocetra persica]
MTPTMVPESHDGFSNDSTKAPELPNVLSDDFNDAPQSHDMTAPMKAPELHNDLSDISNNGTRITRWLQSHTTTSATTPTTITSKFW